MKTVVVIGGGIVGLSTAYYLNKMGYEVTVVDQSAMDSGASYVNAGYISPSHIIPLASPGVVRQGMKWMLNSASPLYIQPRLNPDFLSWLWAFNKSCTEDNVKKSILPLKNISLLSQLLFSQIRKEEAFTFHMETKGLLVLYKTVVHGEKEKKFVTLVQEQGMEAKTLSKEEVQAMEPHLELDVMGGSLYNCDWHSTPKEFMQELQANLEKKGVLMYRNEPVLGVQMKHGVVEKIVGKHHSFEADEYVMAAGTWSHGLAKKLGVHLRLQSGKGYRIDSLWDTKITTPAILSENKVAVTPMNGFTRFAGTMEISGINHRIRKERVDAIAHSVSKYYPGLKVGEEEKEKALCGLRPLSPDGRPFIGKSSKCKNVTFATGHAMMGWSMGPGTGKLVAELLSGVETSMDITPFHPDRRF